MEVLLKRFCLNGHTIGLKHSSLYHVRVLLKRFHLNGHTIGFEAQFIVPCESTAYKRFHLNGHTIGFEAQT